MKLNLVALDRSQCVRKSRIGLDFLRTLVQLRFLYLLRSAYKDYHHFCFHRFRTKESILRD